MRLVFGIIILFLTIGTAHADCANPAGVEGEQVYNSTHKVMQYCDGTDWTAMRATGKLDVSGGTMTGALILSGAPLANTQAATKEYVDTIAGAAGNIPHDSTNCSDGQEMQWRWSAGASQAELSCTPEECSLPWGGTIAHGNNVTAYQTASVSYDSSCSSQTRTCNNGTLSGAYTHQNCSVNSPASCSLPWGGTIAHGASVTAYQSSTSNCSSSETRMCSNGTLSGAYVNASCDEGGCGSNTTTCKAISVNSQNYRITIASSSSESCSSACSARGLGSCDETKLQALWTEAKADWSGFVSTKLGFSNSGTLLSLGTPFFGLGCSASTWSFTNFQSPLSGCSVSDVRMDSGTAPTCNGGGYNNGNYSGPRICVCE